MFNMEQALLNFDSPHLPDEAAVLACLGHGRESAVSSTIIEAQDGVEAEKGAADYSQVEA